MQNNFEKQVQEKMAELRFAPSVPVWQNIEEAIKKNKDHRRGIFWFIFFSLLSGGLLASLVLDKNYYAGIKHYTLLQRIATKEPKKPERVTITNSYGAIIIQKTNLKTNLPSATVSFNKEESNKQQLARSNKKVMDAEPPETTEPDFPVLTKESKNNLQQNLTVDEPAYVANAIIKKEVKLKPDSSQSIVKTTKKETKWQFGSSFFLGVSGIKTDHAGILLNSSSVSATAAPSYHSPSSQTNGLSVSAGFFVKRKMSNRLTLLSGISYQYYSTRQMVGNKIKTDTTLNTNQGFLPVAGYYVNSSTQTYTNQYHYISIPLTVEYRFAKHIPLEVFGGISLQQLMHTNMVLYDERNDIYYQNQKELNKTQLFTELGLQYQFQAKRNFSIKAGPTVQYGLTETTNNGLRQHLYTIGIKTQFVFGK